MQNMFFTFRNLVNFLLFTRALYLLLYYSYQIVFISAITYGTNEDYLV